MSARTQSLYYSLCRGENPIEVDNKLLFCDYANNNDPRLILAPFRRETLSLDPWIAIYYNVINDEEIRFIKEEAFSRVFFCFTAWLSNATVSQYSRRILQRVSAITQLNLETAEDFQVANYGLGGHYIPHVDYAGNPIVFGNKGNRIATFMVYLSDVELGGSTVFTEIGVKVKPLKGSAVFWFNLQKNGGGDRRTRHAACPVIIGNKWVMNKWIHEGGNELWHPCGSTESDFFLQSDLRGSVPTSQRYYGRHF